jgi:hypothetical protein
MNSAAALAAPRRFNSTVARSLKEQPQSKVWLSDPGSYPIIVIVCGATMGWIGFLGYKFMYWYVDMHTHTHIQRPHDLSLVACGSLTHTHFMLLLRTAPRFAFRARPRARSYERGKSLREAFFLCSRKIGRIRVVVVVDPFGLQHHRLPLRFQRMAN